MSTSRYWNRTGTYRIIKFLQPTAVCDSQQVLAESRFYAGNIRAIPIGATGTRQTLIPVPQATDNADETDSSSSEDVDDDFSDPNFELPKKKRKRIKLSRNQVSSSDSSSESEGDTASALACNSSEIDKDISEEPSVSEMATDVNNVQDDNGLFHGEEVYLMYNSFLIFKAKYDHCAPGTTVHFVPLMNDDCRFFIFISNVLKNAGKWEKFEVDEHTKGAATLWKSSDVKRIEVVDADIIRPY